MVEAVPGLFAVQHAGGGKSNQYFLRGFDADHGTDVAFFTDGIPVNMPSHGHGQGFSDLHFIGPTPRSTDARSRTAVDVTSKKSHRAAEPPHGAPASRPAVAAGSDLVRFGVAVERPLLDAFDQHLARRGYENRSEALRDLVRAELARDAWDRGEQAIATISLIYDHHVRELTERLVEIQHDHGDRVISTIHVHLDHDHCLEVVLARGPANVLKRLADRLIGAKGVISGEVSGMSIVGRPATPAKRAGAPHRHEP